MTQKEFLDFCRQSNILKDNNFDIKIRWLAIEKSGGNCWEDESQIVYASFCDLDFPEFNLLVNKFCSNFSDLELEKLEKELIKKDWEYEQGWYGNKQEFKSKEFNLIKFYQYLQFLGEI